MAEMDENQLLEAARAFGRINSAKRRIVELTCTVCGTPISGTLKRRYCSNRCAVRAFRQRQAAAERAGATEASQSVEPPAEDSDTLPEGPSPHAPRGRLVPEASDALPSRASSIVASSRH